MAEPQYFVDRPHAGEPVPRGFVPDQLLSTDPAAGLLSTDPNAGVRRMGPAQGWTWADQPSGPRIGPAQPGTALPPATADTPVTLGEVMADPSAAFQRIGVLLKRDLTDPRMWLSAAAAYFGPKAIGTVWPVAARAVASIEPTQIVGKGLQVGGRVVQSPMKAVGKGIEALGDRLVTSPAGSAPAATPVVTLADAVQTATKQRFSASEFGHMRQWIDAGVAPDAAVQRILATRQLQQAGPFAHLPTDVEVARSVDMRNMTGKWP